MREEEATPTIGKVLIIPNYEGLFNGFLKDFTMQATGLCHQDTETHRLMHGILASLNIAAQTITSDESFEKFRTQLADVVTESSSQLLEKE
jgi:hypothetical protein